MRLSLILAVIALISVPAPSAEPPAKSRPNIVVILSDDQGRGDNSAFGTKDVRTPRGITGISNRSPIRSF